MKQAHVFFNEGKLYLIPELPVKPEYIDIFSKSSTDKFYEYEKKLLEAKANALPVVNPELANEFIEQRSIDIERLYEWPGEWTFCSLDGRNAIVAAKLIAPPTATSEQGMNAVFKKLTGGLKPKNESNVFCPFHTSSKNTFGSVDYDLCINKPIYQVSFRNATKGKLTKRYVCGVHYNMLLKNSKKALKEWQFDTELKIIKHL